MLQQSFEIGGGVAAEHERGHTVHESAFCIPPSFGGTAPEGIDQTKPYVIGGDPYANGSLALCGKHDDAGGAKGNDGYGGKMSDPPAPRTGGVQQVVGGETITVIVPKGK